MLLSNMFCTHQAASIRYVPRKGSEEGSYIAYCPKCHKYGRITLSDDDEIESIKWSRGPGDISSFKYVSNERGDTFGLQ